MTYQFKQTPPMPTGDIVVATALDGVIYTENNRLHIKCSDKHYIYKYDAVQIGWYVRHQKTFDDIYLGKGAAPSAQLETLEVKDAVYFEQIKQPPRPPREKGEVFAKWQL